ncbi:hypothetical protein [Tissierella sp. Yu-01]|uniref:hypothetical protein n=1 Tax=Tissierella sp. Yu-01 TaxID=3035694 RepID=UPI00240E4AA4|nr:hypothetical protein [Tissierella sp. Yu-01]WFA08609.1 hypothetical protein P3962_12910 [Tissierella sp. Yu-01]WFA09036.1 hypothetical protein P3962_00270 [Tissierella sp. Yu-01]
MRLSKEYSSSASLILEAAIDREFKSECRILKGFPTKVWLGSAIDIQLKSAPTSIPTEINESYLIIFDMSDISFLIGIHFQAMSTHPSM